MACLGSVTYDPASQTNANTGASSLSALTAFDTTNARITFTAPASGNVLVRIRVAHRGANQAMLLLGVLESSTVKGRIAPYISRDSAASTGRRTCQATFVVTGLTPGNSYTWDAAYAVQVLGTSSNLSWGGPNDTTGNDASGALRFEVWDAANLLGGVLYDPGSAVSKSVASLTAMTAFDTTNLRLTFTAPSSGRVLVNIRCAATGAASAAVANCLFGVLDGATVRGRAHAAGINPQTATTAASDIHVYDYSCIVSGLTGGNSYTWDAAYAVQVVLASQNIKYGGPNNNSGNNAWGGIAYEIWSA